jgi:VanZ family protein
MPPAVWAVVIGVLTSWPNPRALDALPADFDKLGHLLMYAVLGYLVFRALELMPTRLAAITLAVALCVAWGALDEWHQVLVPGRAADFADWMADAAGGAIGVFVRAIRPKLLAPGIA